MTRVCLVGDADVNLQYELLSRETARDALATYDLREPFANAVGVETVSLGAAVALLNDLDWYLVRFVEESMVLEPSVSETEWLSRDLANAIREDDVGPEESARFLKVYGLEPASDAGQPAASPGGSAGPGEDSSDGPMDGETAGEADGDPPPGATGDEAPASGGPAAGTRGDDAARRLVEPMYVTRTGADIPEYDLRDVEETLVERVTEAEFGA